jgi:hypothetical protein
MHKLVGLVLRSLVDLVLSRLELIHNLLVGHKLVGLVLDSLVLDKKEQEHYKNCHSLELACCMMVKELSSLADLVLGKKELELNS